MTSHGDRSFSFAPFHVRNSISVGCTPLVSAFRSRLITCLFLKIYKDRTRYFDHCVHVHALAVLLNSCQLLLLKNSALMCIKSVNVIEHCLF